MGSLLCGLDRLSIIFIIDRTKSLINLFAGVQRKGARAFLMWFGDPKKMLEFDFLITFSFLRFFGSTAHVFSPNSRWHPSALTH